MEEKKFTLFWKKLLIMNLGLLLILVRIFGMLLGYFTRKSTNDSIFPTYNENGYPFFDSINCDLRGLVPIIDTITTEKESSNQTISENKDKLAFNSFINRLKSQKCSFYNQLNICSDNKKCFNELNDVKLGLQDNINSFSYHSSDNKGKLKVSNLIQICQNKNEFISENNIQMEIAPYYQIISGYYSYLNIKLYEQNNKKNFDILKEITNYEEKVNNLFYFHSLFLKAHSMINKNKIFPKEDSAKYIDQCLKESEDQLTNKKSIFYTSEKNKQRMIDIIENDLSQIINCIPDFNQRYSYSVDIYAIKIMLKILLGENENISKIDKRILNFYLKELSKSLKTILIADFEIRKGANLYEKYQPYFITIYICMSFCGLIFTNRYFIKNKEYYNQSSQILAKYKRDKYNFYHNNKHHQYWERIREMEKKKKEEEMKKKNNENNENKENNKGNNKEDNNFDDKDKCTKEELEYIEKLAKEHKGDFILTK